MNLVNFIYNTFYIYIFIKIYVFYKDIFKNEWAVSKLFFRKEMDETTHNYFTNLEI